MPQADAHHAASRHNALTTTHTHKHKSTPQPPLQQDAHISSRPQSKSIGTPAHNKLCRADETREWACEMRKGVKHTPRSHARITTPLTQRAWAGRRQRAKGGAPWFLAWSATPFQRSRKFRQSAPDAKRISHGNGFAFGKVTCLKYRPRPPTGRRRPDVLGPLRPPTESSGLRRVATGPARALASTNDLHGLH